MNTTTATSAPDSQFTRDDYHRSTPALERPVRGRMVAGVAAGVGRSFGVDPAVIRIILCVLVFAGGIGLPLYLAGWLLIPEEGREQSLASDLIQSFQSRSR